MAHKGPADFDRTFPTREEMADWLGSHRYPPSVYRVVHRPCGKRLWGSGLGIGAHRRACKVSSAPRTA